MVVFGEPKKLRGDGKAPGGCEMTLVQRILVLLCK